MPSICTICQHYHKTGLAICARCVKVLEKITYPCRHCARPLPDPHGLICGHCIQSPPFFDTVYSPYLFAEPLRSLIHAFKYQQALYLRQFLAQQMLQTTPLIQAALTNVCLLPVPLHPTRLRERGFNQALELAKILSKKTRIALTKNLCQRNRATPSQVGLSAKARQENLSSAFQAEPSQYQQVILVDDLMTTGSTANALAKALKAQGVKRVDVWCCARAVKT